jgi:hypothetical protein
MSIILEYIRTKGYGGGICYSINAIVGHYLIAKKNNLHFYLDDRAWPFQNEEGWCDYFDSVITWNHSIKEDTKYIIKSTEFDINYNSPYFIFSKENCFTLQEYRDAYKYIAHLNTLMIEKMNDILKKHNLIPGEYDSIMIRRGDKMLSESLYIDTEKYLNQLIEKDTKTIFLQTDDYDCFIELSNIIKEKYNNSIRLVTTCPEWKKGQITAVGVKSQIIEKIIESNFDNTIMRNLKNLECCYKLVCANNKTTEEYNPIEMKEHIEEVLIGLEICTLSRYISSELQSNVTRYLYCKHHNIDNFLALEMPSVCEFENSINGNIKPRLDTLIYNPIKDFRHIVD